MASEKETGGVEYRHHPWYLVAILGSIFVFIFNLSFNYLNTFLPAGTIYVSTIGAISDRYYLMITPAGWTFTIWAVIYFWQAAWMIYSFASIFRKCDSGYLYQYPPIIPIWSYPLYALISSLTLAWLFAFDRSLNQPSLLILALVILIAVPSLINVQLALSYRKFAETTRLLRDHGLNADVWLIRMLYHNGIAFFMGWTFCASLLNTGFVLIYNIGVDNSTASTAVLGLLGSLLILYFSLDIFLLDRFMRYQFSQYIPVIMALGGSTAKNYEANGPTSTNSVMTVVLLAIALSMFVVKLVMLVVRHCKDPGHQGSAASIQPITEREEPPAYGATEKV